MTVSDLLTLIGILLAIFAFISERNREYIFLKFSRTHVIMLILGVLYIHFLLSFNWWSNKFPRLNYFRMEGWPEPEVWAYTLSVSVLGWATWRVFFGTFPLSRRMQLMSYYGKLLLRNDTAFLAQLVENNHLNDVVSYLKAKKDIQVEEPTGIWPIDHQEYLKVYSKKIKGRSLVYGNTIYYQIILSDVFIDEVAKVNPYLFATVIEQMNVQKLKDDEFVNRFLKVLMANKNGAFFREIRNNQNLEDGLNTYRIERERPILYALFNDVNVCSINQAWRGIGESAILEMREEAVKDYSFLRDSEKEQHQDTIWSFRITNAIWYFDIMVRQAIKQELNDHMWMYYYVHFVSAILANMEPLPSPDSDQNNPSRNFSLLEDIFKKMMDWKDVAIKTKHGQLNNSICDLIGQCVYKVAITDKLNNEDKHYLINRIWENILESYGDDAASNLIVEDLVTRSFEKFRLPSTLLLHNDDDKATYLSMIEHLWDNRDTPKLYGVAGTRAARFKTEVVDQLLA